MSHLTAPAQAPNRFPFRRSVLNTFLATLLLGFLPLFTHAEPPLDPPFVNPPWPGRPTPSADQPLPYGLRYVHEALPGAANGGRAIGHVVLLPEGYDAPENADRRWPVLFFLHGRTGTEMADFRFGTNYARAAHEKRLPGLILVFPNGMNEGYADRADGSMAVQTHIIRELLPFIDAMYRTLPAQRAVAGFSMGGYGAVRFRLKYPELFTHAVAIDSYLFSPRDTGGGYRSIFGSQNVKDANAALSLLDAALARDPALSKAINLLMIQAPHKPDSSSGTHAFVRALESRSIPVTSYDAPLAHDAALFYDRFEAEIMAFHRPFFSSPGP